MDESGKITTTSGMDMTLLVLAAGIGSRYGGLKQMEGFGPDGETILEYSVYDALRAGFTEFVFVIRKAIEKDFRERILSRLPRDLNVKLCFQELDKLPEGYSVPEGRTKPWGTGHAVWVAREDVSGPFALVNGDDFYGRKGFESIARHFRDRTCHAVVAYPLSQTLSLHGSVSRGLCTVNEEGQLSGLDEIVNIAPRAGVLVGQKDGSDYEISADALVSMNLFAFQPSLFEALERDLKAFMETSGNELKSEFYITAVVDRIIEGRETVVDVLTSEDSWLGVTNPEDKARVISGIRGLVDAGVYPTPLWG